MSGPPRSRHRSHLCLPVHYLRYLLAPSSIHSPPETPAHPPYRYPPHLLSHHHSGSYTVREGALWLPTGVTRALHNPFVYEFYSPLRLGSTFKRLDVISYILDEALVRTHLTRLRSCARWGKGGRRVARSSDTEARGGCEGI
jgi:hypothetical protein